MKHFSQKWYLSARSPYFGELHRWPSPQPITDRARRSSRQSGQGRAGQAGGAHTQEEAEGKVGRRQAANRDAGFLCGRVFLILRINFGADDWSHQSRPMQTSQALKKEGENGRRGREEWRWGRGVQNEY